MTDVVECASQADVDRVTANGDIAVVRAGYVTAYDSAQVTAYGSAQVTAYDSAQVTASGSAQVTAYGSAQVRAYGSAQVTAYDSAQVTAYGSAQVTAYGSAQVTASGSAQVRASRFVAVTASGDLVKVDGGVLIQVPKLTTAAEWCEFYGVVPDGGVVTLYKATGADFATRNGVAYVPGTTPEAKDWDGGTTECGFGLHFSPRPFMARTFRPWDEMGTRFVACPVRLDEIVVHANAIYPAKVKAPRVCAPCWEVDEDGKAIETGAVEAEAAV